MTTFSEKIIDLREKHGWTKTYVADKLGLSSMQVYANYEYGIREPDFDTVIKLAKLYNVTTDYLLGFTSTKKTISIQDALSTIEYSNGKTIHKEDMPALTKVIEKFLR